MGTTTLLCCRKTKATTTTTANEEDEKNTRNVGSFAKIVKQSCIWTTKKKNNIRQLNNLHLQEKNDNNNNNTEDQQLVTLEDWILGSPSLKNLQSFINDNSIDEGDSQSHLMVVSKQTYNNNNNNSRVYPTFDRNLQERSSCNFLAKSSDEKFNKSMMEKSAKFLGEEKDDFSQSCSSKIKIKKKVSFRLPRVADILKLDSPEGHFENI